MSGFGFGAGFGAAPRSRRLLSPYSTETLAYLAAMAVQPDATRKALLDTLIVALMTSGAWADLDWISPMWMHDAQAARINAVTPALAATPINSPIFTVDRGYTFNGATSYLDTGWNPSTAGGKFVQNDNTMGIWIGTEVSSGTQYDIGNSNAAINARNSAIGLVTAQSAASSNVTLPASSSIGLTAFTRTGAIAGQGYKNGAATGAAITSTSTALRNASFLIGAANSNTTGGVTAGSFSTRRADAYFWGRGLNSTKQAAIHAALAAYKTAVGA